MMGLSQAGRPGSRDGIIGKGLDRAWGYGGGNSGWVVHWGLYTAAAVRCFACRLRGKDAARRLGVAVRSNGRHQLDITFPREQRYLDRQAGRRYHRRIVRIVV